MSQTARGALLYHWAVVHALIAARPAAPRTPGAHRMTRTLVMDDDAVLRGSVCAVLEHAGYEVVAAADRADGLRQSLAAPAAVVRDRPGDAGDGWAAAEHGAATHCAHGDGARHLWASTRASPPHVGRSRELVGKT